MSSRIGSLDFLVHELTKLPGIGEKTALRLAYFILRQGRQYSGQLREALRQVEEQIHPCPQCFAYTDSDGLCHLCNDPTRDNHTLCIVEDPADIMKVETAGVFKGRYHVLQGALAPLEGVGPDDLKIQELSDRIESGLRGETPRIDEIILALDADLEGDTTALYLAKVVQSKSVKLTRIAYGVPFGMDMDFIDKRTLGRALENRVEM